MGKTSKLTEQELFFLGWNLGHTPTNPSSQRAEWVCVCGATYTSSFASHLLRHAYKYLREHGRANLNPAYLERPELPPELARFTPATRPRRRRPQFVSDQPVTAPSTSAVTTRHTAAERAAWRAERVRQREGTP